MPSYLDDNKAPYQDNPEMLPPDRAQLKKTASGCGCRCRTRGIEEEGEGGSNDDDNASTLVGSMGSDSEFPDSSDGPEPHVSARSISEARTRIGGIFEIGVEGFRLGQPVVETEPLRPHRIPSFYEERTESMRNQHGSEDHSVVVSDARSPRSMSPGPGIGMWIGRELELRELHFSEYHFLVRPLRLTPQHRYCRGLVTSHMVVPDEGFYGRDG